MMRIWCRVSGGVTGTRETWLKKNGEVREFETREQAQAEVDRLNVIRNNSNSVASFSYAVYEQCGGFDEICQKCGEVHDGEICPQQY